MKKALSVLICFILMMGTFCPPASAAELLVIDEQFPSPWPYTLGETKATSADFPTNGSQIAGNWYKGYFRHTNLTVLAPGMDDYQPGGDKNVIRLSDRADTNAPTPIYALPEITSGTVSVEMRLYKTARNVANDLQQTISVGGATINFHDGGDRVQVVGTSAAVSTKYGNYTAGWHTIKFILFKSAGSENYDKVKLYYDAFTGGSGSVLNGAELTLTAPVAAVNRINFSLGYKTGVVSPPLYLDYISVSVDGATEKGSLEKPAAPVWNASTLQWTDSQLNTASYEVALYKNHSLYGTYTFATTSKSYDFFDVLATDTDADWTAALTVKGTKLAMDKLYADSPASDRSAAWIAPPKPAAPGKPWWEANTLCWEAAQNAERYTVYLYKDGSLSDTVSNLTGTSVDLAGYMIIAGDGTYTAAVQCFSGIIGSPVSEFSDGAVFALNDSRHAAEVVDFEPPVYKAGDELRALKGELSALIMAQGGGLTGQYLNIERLKAGSDRHYFELPSSVLAATRHSGEIMSMKFRIYLSGNAPVYLTAGPAGLQFNGGAVSYLTKTADYNAFGGAGLAYTAGGWNELEILFRKDTVGASSPYTSAQYFLNGIQGNTGANPTLPDAARTYLDGIAVNPTAVGADGAVYIDEIYVYAFTPPKDALTVINEQLASLRLPTAVSTEDDITLPSSLSFGTIKTTWASDKKTVISDSGEVRRPPYTSGGAVSTDATLTVTAIKDGATVTKEYRISVLHVYEGDLAAGAVKSPWRTQPNGSVQMDFNLGGEKKINCVLINRLSENVGTLDIQYSTNGSSYQTAYSSSRPHGSIMTFPVVTAGYLRLVVSQKDAGDVTSGAVELYRFASTGELLDDVLKLINLGDTSKVSGNLTLPASGLYGTPIVWMSSNPGVISVSGVVKQPTAAQGKATVTLSATVTAEGIEQTRTFTVTVLPSVTSNVSGNSGGLHGGGGGSVMSGIVFPVTENPVLPSPNQGQNVQNNGFFDTSGHWAEEYIAELKEKGVVWGGPGGGFNPDAQITRAELLAMVMRAVGISEKSYLGDFSDVFASDWYSGVIEAGLDAGLISRGSAFRPNDDVTREEMCKIIIGAASFLTDLSAGDFPLRYTDSAAISDWAVDYVRSASRHGLMTGMDDGSFAPQGGATRAQTAAVLSRLLRQ